jgi:uncharacterized protein
MLMANKILITGGTGLVGSRLSEVLLSAGHQVVHLSRTASKSGTIETFKWDIKEGLIDEGVFEGVTHIIHLAGAGVADARWTDKRKKEILDSRVKSTRLLYEYAKRLNLQLTAFISASAIGIYGDTGDLIVDETTKRGAGFLADVVEEWETAVDQFQEITKVAKIRIGVVLSAEGGALAAIAQPVKLYAGAPLGSGKQYMSWIHDDDLVEIFQFAMDHDLEGVFNAVAPNPVTNQKLTQLIAKALRKPLFLPNVPSFMMKLILGQMAEMVLMGTNVSSKKIEEAGYNFEYSDCEKAISNLIQRETDK